LIDGGLVFTVFVIGVALAADRDVVHRGNVHDDRALGREIVLPVFFLEIKCHLQIYAYSSTCTKENGGTFLHYDDGQDGLGP